MQTKDLKALLELIDSTTPEQNLIYVFYTTPAGTVRNFTISVHSAHTPSGRKMSAADLGRLMKGYPDAANGNILAIDHPNEGLTHWLDTVEVCDMLHTTPQTLRRWRKQKVLKASHIGRKLYYDRAEVDALLHSNMIQENGRLDTVHEP